MSDHNLLLVFLKLYINDQKKKKNFKHFLELPVEMRMMIVNEMPVDDRCRFSGCSKLSYKEANNSKDYIREFKFNLDAYENDIYLHVKYGPENEDRYGFRIRYIEEERKKYVKLENLEGREMDVTELDKETDLSEFAAKNCRNLLRIYEERIKKLDISLSDWRARIESFHFGVKNLKNLEELELFCVLDTRQFLSKTRKDLKKIKIIIIRNLDFALEECRQIRRTQNYLYLNSDRFTISQFLELSARQIHIPIGEITEADIFNLVRSWQNGTFRKQFRYYCWCINGSTFNVSKLFKLFGEEYTEHGVQGFQIKHDHDAGKCAGLRLYDWGGFSDLRSILFLNAYAE